MTKPTEVTFTTLAPLLIQHYERYLPTAFDDQMTMVQKMNKIMVYLNEIGKVTNDVIEKWNEVILWVVGEGLTESVVAKLDSMVADGTLAGVINETLFDDLNVSIASVSNRVDTSKTEVLNVIAEYGKNVKQYGAVGNYVDINNKGTNDATAFQNALNQKGRIFVPKGNYYINTSLIVYSDTEIIMSPDAKIYTEGIYAFNFPNGIENVRITGGKLFSINVSGSTTYAFFFNGARTSYTTAIRDIKVDKVYAEGFKWFAYMRCLRKATFDSIHSYNSNGVMYLDKSAEVVIANSNFVRYEPTTISGTYGLFSEAVDGNYPEGLTIDNTLFYHFWKNLYIRDLYVGMFNNLLLDAGVTGCLESEINYNTRAQVLKFNNTWCLGKGFFLTSSGATSPKELRAVFANTTFDGLDDIGFELRDWIHEVDMINTNVYGVLPAKAIGVVTINQNNNIKVSGYKGKYMLSNIQIKGNGQYVDLFDISNFDNLALDLHLYVEHTVNVNGMPKVP